MDNGVGPDRPGDGMDDVNADPWRDAAIVHDWSETVTDGPETADDVPPQRILVVDDDTDSATMLAALLGSWDYSVEIAEEGRSAIEAALAFAPQVILLDIDLPWLDGYEIARLLRGDTAFDSVRIVALTGHHGDEYRHRSLQAGFDDHLTKPIDLPLLRSVMGRRRRAGLSS